MREAKGKGWNLELPLAQNMQHLSLLSRDCCSWVCTWRHWERSRHLHFPFCLTELFISLLNGQVPSGEETESPISWSESQADCACAFTVMKTRTGKYLPCSQPIIASLSTALFPTNTVSGELQTQEEVQRFCCKIKPVLSVLCIYYK